AAEERRRPEGHQVPHLQPAHRAPRRAARREPDGGQVPDVPQKVATGGNQAEINSSGTGTAPQSGEVRKNYYATDAFHPKNAVVVNARAFSRLPADQRKALTDAASKAETRGWAMSKVRTLEANETLQKNGMTIHQPDAAMKSAFAKVG